MWDNLRPLMAGLDPVRIESHMTQGNPDVNYLHGWVELKYLRCWPKRPSTRVRFPHDFSAEQRSWATRRAAAGGLAFFLVKVGGHGHEMGEEWLLFHGALAYREVGTVTRQILYQLAFARWVRRPTQQEIQRCLVPPSHHHLRGADTAALYPNSPPSKPVARSAWSSGAVDTG